MVEKRLVVLALLVIKFDASLSAFFLLPQRLLQDGLNECVNDGHILVRLRLEDLLERPEPTDAGTFGYNALCGGKRVRELLFDSLRFLVSSVGRHAVRVGERRMQAVHAATKEELGRRVEREPRDQVLESVSVTSLR